MNTNDNPVDLAGTKWSLESFSVICSRRRTDPAFALRKVREVHQGKLNLT